MKLLEALKWLWDPRDEDEKAYSKWSKEAPLQRRNQELFIYVRDRAEPFRCEFEETDFRTGDWTFRRASNEGIFNDYLSEWLTERGTKGVRVDSVWYSPKSIVRIELGEQTVEAI